MRAFSPNVHLSFELYMCGIAGYFGAGQFLSEPYARALGRRGPDATGGWCTNVGGGHFIHLVHTRLSVLDLSTAANQPMQLIRSEQGTWVLRTGDSERGHHYSGGAGYTLTYNGEIYNFASLRDELRGKGHVFASSGDTEVLLRGYAEWGRAVFSKLDGAFAVMIHDGPAGKLVIARDHLGLKPLYFARTNDGGYVFASQVRAIVAGGQWSGQINRSALLDYLRFGSFQEPATVFTGIYAFEPGCVGWVELADGTPGILRTERYWMPISSLLADKPDDWRTEHAAVWRETVRDQLVADVPTGVFLSGGLDSTLLLETAVRESRGRLTAFTVGGDITTHCETDLAAKTARNLGVEHVMLHLEKSDRDAWSRLSLAAMDQPSCDGLNMFVVSRAARASGLVVALGGAGADEFHGAYGYAQTLTRIHRWAHSLGGIEPIFSTLATVLLGHMRGPVARERLSLMLAQAHSPWRLLQEKRRFFTPSQISDLWPEANTIPQRWHAPLGDAAVMASFQPEVQITLAEACGYLLNTLLRDSDWATMENSLELRLPYLGKRYVELMLRMPLEFTAKNGAVKKPLLANLISPMNRELIGIPKRGFSINYAELLRGPFREEFRVSCQWLDLNLGFRLIGSDVVNRMGHDGTGKSANRLWALFTLGHYLSRM